MIVKASAYVPLVNSACGLRRGVTCFATRFTQQLREHGSVVEKSMSRERMHEHYLRTLEKCKSKKLPQDVNPRGVFACNELDLKEVQVYGFDYDYTLACYKPSMDYLLYNLGRDMLIKKYKYPEGIGKLEYREGFAVRGLHYDIEKGLLLKLDSFLQIQLGTVYRGLHPVPDDEVLRLYKNRIIPIAYVEAPHKHSQDGIKRTKMVQLADLFSVPEMGLLCNVTEYFLRNHIDYHPEILFRDVKNSVQSCHPIMHQMVVNNVSEYLEQTKDLVKFFDRLKAAGKRMFLVTNSPFHFVDKGMRFLVGDDWKHYFDVVIVQARKPRFFTEESRPLRIYDEEKQTQLWDRVTSIEKGVIYLEGTVKQLQDMTGWRGHQVLYFGDHPYSDLADVTLEHGWRTGAIIKELTHEIETLNDQRFKENANWLQMLTGLIEDYQDYEGPEAQEQFDEWMRERDELRNEIKRVFNQQFGSVFRTYHNPTYFSRRLFRFADIYMSSITNLLGYSPSHTFYPRRGVMPHEYTSYFVSTADKANQDEALSYEEQHRKSGVALGEISIITEHQVKASAVEIPETIKEEDTIEETLRKSASMLAKNLEKMSLMELRKKTKNGNAVPMKPTKRVSLSEEEPTEIEVPLKGEELIREKQRGSIAIGRNSIFTISNTKQLTRSSTAESAEKVRRTETARPSSLKTTSKILSTGQSQNIGAHNMFFAALRSTPLPRFEANAIVCILQECLDYLSLLKYVIPAEVDPRWEEGYKTIKELYGGPAEPRLIFRKDLGLLPLVPTAAEKLQRDRHYAYCVLSETNEEIMETGTYDSLQKTVDICVRTQEGENILQLNCDILADQVKQLYELIRLRDKQSQESFAKYAEAAAKVNAEVDNSIFLNGSKLAYLERREAARVEMHLHRLKLKEMKLTDKLTEYSLMERMDAIVSGEVCTYLQANMKDMEDEIMVWTSQYNEEIERREQEINEFKDQISEQKIILEQLYFVRNERQALIDECEAEKERVKEQVEYWKIIHRSATIIQSLWRGHMVRNQLGDYKGLWNALKKRKKQAAKARKKRESEQRKMAEELAKKNSKNRSKK